MEQPKKKNRIAWGSERLAVIQSNCKVMTHAKMAKHFGITSRHLSIVIKRYREAGNVIVFAYSEKHIPKEKLIPYLKDNLHVTPLTVMAKHLNVSEHTLSTRIYRLRRAGVELPKHRGLSAPIGTEVIDSRGHKKIKSIDGRWLSPSNLNPDFTPMTKEQKPKKIKVEKPKIKKIKPQKEKIIKPPKQPIRDIGRPTKPIKEIQKYEDKPEKPGRHVYISRGVYVRDTLNRTDEQVREDYRKTIERQKEHK